MKNFKTIEFVIYATIISIAYLLAIVSFYKTSFYDFDFFSIALGLILWSAFYTNSQRIISEDLFAEFALIGILTLGLNIILFRWTGGSLVPVIFAAYPLLYVLYFRLLLQLFFRDFQKSPRKPAVSLASKRQWTAESDNYIPSRKEEIFSVLLYLGFFIVAGGLTVLLL